MARTRCRRGVSQRGAAALVRGVARQTRLAGDAARHPPRRAAAGLRGRATRSSSWTRSSRGYDAAATAARPGPSRSGIETVAAERIGETAVPLERRRPRPRWVAVLSDPLDEVEDNVALIRRQILIAGAIALGSRAARRVPRGRARTRGGCAGSSGPPSRSREGDFSVPIPVDSTDEVGQLAMTLDEMQRRLARLDSARKEFIANASHELRTPIFSLGGFVELLEDEEPDPRHARRVRAHDARAGRPADEADDRPARPLEARRRGDRARAASRSTSASWRSEVGARVRGRGRARTAPARGRRPRAEPLSRAPTPIGSRRSSVSCSTTPSPTRRRERRSR